MVNQVAQSGISIFLMGCAGYAFGHFAKMDPKITATVWLVAEVSKHVFDYINISQRYDAEITIACRGYILAFTILGIPLALVALRQIHTFSKGFMCFLATTSTVIALNDLRLGRKIVKPVKPFSPQTQHPANVNP